MDLGFGRLRQCVAGFNMAAEFTAVYLAAGVIEGIASYIIAAERIQPDGIVRIMFADDHPGGIFIFFQV